MNMIDSAKQIKDEDAKIILEHPENFPIDWVENAKDRFR